MNELPNVEALEHSYRARRVGVEALELELHGETPERVVDISIHLNGRTIVTTTNAATVERIMRILTGLEQ